MQVRKRDPLYEAFQPIVGVDGCRMSDGFKGYLEVPLRDGSFMLIKPGQWVVRGEDGVNVHNDADFKRLYERV